MKKRKGGAGMVTKAAPKVLDAIADRVLAYKPKPKSAAAKKRQGRRRYLRRKSKA